MSGPSEKTMKVGCSAGVCFTGFCCWVAMRPNIEGALILFGAVCTLYFASWILTSYSSKPGSYGDW